MNRKSFIRSLIGIPFIGAIASDLVAKESVKKVASILIPRVSNINDIKNPVVGKLLYLTSEVNKGFWMYTEHGWISIVIR